MALQFRHPDLSIAYRYVSFRSKPMIACPGVKETGSSVRRRMRIGLLSDTHGSERPLFFRHFRRMRRDLARRDFGSVEILDRLKAFRPSGALRDVDGAELRVPIFLKLLRGYCEGVSVYCAHRRLSGQFTTGGQGKKSGRLLPGLFILRSPHILKVVRDPRRPASYESRRLRSPRMGTSSARSLAIHLESGRISAPGCRTGTSRTGQSAA